MVSSYLLDSDIVLDFLLKRTPFNAAPKEIFSLALKKSRGLYFIFSDRQCSLPSLKSSGKMDSLLLVEQLTGFSKILSIGENEILLAIRSDFEDAIRHQTALSNREVQAIITLNLKDYKKSKLPVLSPEAFLALLK